MGPRSNGGAAPAQMGPYFLGTGKPLLGADVKIMWKHRTLKQIVPISARFKTNLDDSSANCIPPPKGEEEISRGESSLQKLSAGADDLNPFHLTSPECVNEKFQVPSNNVH